MKLQDVEIQLPSQTLKGLLGDNPKGRASIVFAHGSGSSRLSSRNQQVAAYLYNRGFSVLLFDLLTPAEDRNYQNRFHIPLLTERLIAGERDEEVLELNMNVYAMLRCEKQLEVVSTATHLFEEPGTLEEVSRLTAAWFEKNLPGEKKHV